MGNIVVPPPQPVFDGDSPWCPPSETPTYLTVGIQGVEACECSENMKYKYSGTGGVNGGHVLTQTEVDASVWSVIKPAVGTLTYYSNFGCQGDITDVFNFVQLSIAVRKLGDFTGRIDATILTDKPSSPVVFSNPLFEVYLKCMCAFGIEHLFSCDGFHGFGGGKADIIEHDWT